jgi:RNA methyltransferase, TrmH family
VFTLRRLSRLGARQRLAKAALILQAAEESLGRGSTPSLGRGSTPSLGRGSSLVRAQAVDAGYLRDLAGLVASWTDGAAAEAAATLAAAPPDSAPDLRRAANGLRHALLARLGAEPSEWDLLTPDGGLDRSGLAVLPIAVYLEDLRSPFNVGAIFRTAEAFGAARVILSPGTPLPSHPRAVRTARGAVEAVPWEVRTLADLDVSAGVFALELGGRDVGTFPFPRAGTVLVGSEELGLSPEALSLAESSLGRVSIALAGAKRSLNVSVAFGILMQRWHEALARPGGLIKVPEVLPAAARPPSPRT